MGGHISWTDLVYRAAMHALRLEPSETKSQPINSTRWNPFFINIITYNYRHSWSRTSLVEIFMEMPGSLRLQWRQGCSHVIQDQGTEHKRVNKNDQTPFPPSRARHVLSQKE